MKGTIGANGPHKAIKDIAPKLAELTNEIIFRDAWKKEGLSQRDRCLITLSSLVTAGNIEQLKYYSQYAKEFVLSEEEMNEVMNHLTYLQRGQKQC
nr:carboxymuconolactone decarboxylase family protein [Lysinibacillus timonensis]